MFETLKALPPDPILGLMAKFREDQRPHKLDLGVGVFRTEEGATPILATVKKAEAWLLKNEVTKTYVGPAGNMQFNTLMTDLALGAEHPANQSERLVLLQTPGGCGALRVAADFISSAKSQARIWTSDPTWANHVPLLGDAGIEIKIYRYYDYENHRICFTEMLEDLQQVQRGDYVLLHACCHNPCGADLSPAQWRQLAELSLEKGFIPFVDMAYQGFGDGLEEDAYGLRLLAEQVPELLVAISCSKNFGLYRERVGAVGVLCADAATAPVVSSHIMHIVRGIYSMPPSHGASIVEHILASDELSGEWKLELQAMRERISGMRQGLVKTMHAEGAGERFDFITAEKGMFSFLGLRQAQVARLAAEHAVYMVGSSRINVAGLNSNNLRPFCRAVLDVLDS